MSVSDDLADRLCSNRGLLLLTQNGLRECRPARRLRMDVMRTIDWSVPGSANPIAISAHSKWTASQTVGRCGSVHSTRWRFRAGDEDVIPYAQRPRGRLMFELQRGATLQHDHPLVPRLILPEAARTSVPLRYNALNL